MGEEREDGKRDKWGKGNRGVRQAEGREVEGE